MSSNDNIENAMARFNCTGNMLSGYNMKNRAWTLIDMVDFMEYLGKGWEFQLLKIKNNISTIKVFNIEASYLHTFYVKFKSPKVKKPTKKIIVKQNVDDDNTESSDDSIDYDSTKEMSNETESTDDDTTDDEFRANQYPKLEKSEDDESEDDNSLVGKTNKFVQYLYDRQCHKVVKEIVTEECMKKRLLPEVKKLASKFKENWKVAETTINKFDVTFSPNYFEQSDFIREASQNRMEMYNFSKRNKSLYDLLYHDLNKYIYELYNLCNLLDVYSELGYGSAFDVDYHSRCNIMLEKFLKIFCNKEKN